jgi:hypothetical protein
VPPDVGWSAADHVDCYSTRLPGRVTDGSPWRPGSSFERLGQRACPTSTTLGRVVSLTRGPRGCFGFGSAAASTDADVAPLSRTWRSLRRLSHLLPGGRMPGLRNVIPTDHGLDPDGDKNHQRDNDGFRMAGQMKHPIVLFGAPSLAKFSCRVRGLENHVENRIVRLASAFAKFRCNPVAALDLQGFSPSCLWICRHLGHPADLMRDAIGLFCR